jgi:hypothetical protein
MIDGLSNPFLSNCVKPPALAILGLALFLCIRLQRKVMGTAQSDHPYRPTQDWIVGHSASHEKNVFRGIATSELATR